MTLSQTRQELEQEPLTETRNRKRLRDNPIAPWEMRIGKYRVFYYVPAETTIVSVVAIGIRSTMSFSSEDRRFRYEKHRPWQAALGLVGSD